MISRRNFVALLSAVRFVGDMLPPKESDGPAWRQFARSLAETSGPPFARAAMRRRRVPASCGGTVWLIPH